MVNAIALGLAGKTDTLGRAKAVSEFIRIGQEYAEIKIELFHDQVGRINCPRDSGQ